jgi:hypothetical protein
MPRQYLVFFLSCLVAITACQKHNSGSTANSAQSLDIYVLGTSNDSLIYWKNGQPTLLTGTHGYQAYGNGIAISGGNVYVSGGSSAIQLPSYGNVWINGIASPLADSAGNAANTEISAIFVHGPDVFVAGIVQYDTTHGIPYTNDSAVYPPSGKVATLWKNGHPAFLPGYTLLASGYGGGAVATHSDYVSGIYISGNDVYVSGGSNGYYADKDSSMQFARYWKNGVNINLTPGLVEKNGTTVVHYPMTTGIFVTGNDVYLSGLRGYNQALYWKNGSPVFLTTEQTYGAAANAIFVAGKDVYVAGNQADASGNNHAVYWKNGSVVQLSNNLSGAYATTVVNGDIYVAGVDYINGTGYATYWKNGVPTHLGSHGFANAIAVLPAP